MAGRLLVGGALEIQRARRTAHSVIEVIVFGEGPTEETFVRDVLSEQLADREIFLDPRLIHTSKGASGGALNWDRVKHFLRNALLQRTDTYVTTLFDLYGLPTEFPGYSEAHRLSEPVQRAAAIENAVHAAIIREVGCREDRFIPHIQPYEFESLLFSDVDTLPIVEEGWQPCLESLRTVRRGASTPEHINDGQQSHPSARLAEILEKPSYDKRLHGAALASRIGIARIRQECAHFGAWLARIEALPPLRVGS